MMFHSILEVDKSSKLKANSCFIIAEAGVNHNGCISRAHDLVDAATSCGADAVKFQSFKADKLATIAAPKAEYQKERTDPEQSQLEMLRELELSATDHKELIDHCIDCEIEFLSTPFDHESFVFLCESGIRRMKIGSGDLTNAPLLLKVASEGCDIILSTGMATLSEIEETLGVLAFGFSNKDKKPTRTDFLEALADSDSYRHLYEKVTLLHCTTEYPTPLEQVNLGAIQTLKHAFGLHCGYSDHTRGINIPIAAVAMGASVLEKHLTLDRSLPGPDHSASIEPAQFQSMVDGIREVEISFGHGRKIPMSVEFKNKLIARKSLVAKKKISKGDVLIEDSMTTKRPGSGKNPITFFDLLGTKAIEDYEPDDFL